MGMGRLGEANFRCGEAGFPPKALDELREKDYVYLLSPEPLDQLDDLGLAIWFYDDGYFHKRSYQAEISCFSKKEAELVQSWFEKKYGLNPKIGKYSGRPLFLIRFRPLDTFKLLEIVRNASPIPNGVEYKVQNIPHHFQRKVTPEIEKEIIEMRGQGMSYSKIAKNLNISPATVARYLEQYRLYESESFNIRSAKT